MNLENKACTNFGSENFSVDYEKAYAAAIRILALRQHSALQLKEKLVKRGFEEQIIAAVIREMLDAKYLNDVEFAMSYIRSARLKLKGDIAINRELKQKGISLSDLENAYSELENEALVENEDLAYGIENDELNRAIRLAEKGFAASNVNVYLTDKADIYAQKRKITTKLIRKLSSKGYSSGIALKATEHVLKKNKEIWDK